MNNSITLKKYATKQYWEKRFLKDKNKLFDWFCSLEKLRPHFDLHFQSHHYSCILMLGCGNSALSEQLLIVYPFFIINVDISFSVLNNIKRKSKQENQDYICDNALNFSFKKDLFDIVVDKGTFDAIACLDSIKDIIVYLEGILKILRTNGLYVLITYRSYDVIHQFSSQVEADSYIFKLKNWNECELNFSTKVRNKIYFQKEKCVDAVSLINAVTEVDRTYLLQKYFEVLKNLTKKKAVSKNLEKSGNVRNTQKLLWNERYRNSCYVIFFSKHKKEVKECVSSLQKTN